jgi:hypothetical protein
MPLLFQKNSNSIFSVFFPLPLLLSKIIYLLHPAHSPFCVACCFVCVRRVLLLLLLLSPLLLAIWLRDDRSSSSRNASLPSLVVGGVTVA